MKTFVIGSGIVAAGIFYFLIDPVVVSLPECPFYQLTNFYCPGCGSQRGLHALLHGDIPRALGYNPLMMIGLLYFLLEAGIWVLRVQGKQFQALSTYRYTPMIVLVIVITFWIFRNIPVSPFNLLAP